MFIIFVKFIYMFNFTLILKFEYSYRIKCALYTFMSIPKKSTILNLLENFILSLYTCYSDISYVILVNQLQN